jgi:hypothetical protein
MPKAGVKPDCRYGHGPLWRIEGVQYPARYLLTSERPLVERDAEKRMVGIEFNGILLQAWECTTCGYTELFEADRVETEDGPGL